MKNYTIEVLSRHPLSMRVIAFALDGGFGLMDTKIDVGKIDLALVYTKVIKYS